MIRILNFLMYQFSGLKKELAEVWQRQLTKKKWSWLSLPFFSYIYQDLMKLFFPSTNRRFLRYFFAPDWTEKVLPLTLDLTYSEQNFNTYFEQSLPDEKCISTHIFDIVLLEISSNLISNRLNRYFWIMISIWSVIPF